MRLRASNLVLPICMPKLLFITKTRKQEQQSLSCLSVCLGLAGRHIFHEIASNSLRSSGGLVPFVFSLVLTTYRKKFTARILARHRPRSTTTNKNRQKKNPYRTSLAGKHPTSIADYLANESSRFLWQRGRRISTRSVILTTIRERGTGRDREGERERREWHVCTYGWGYPYVRKQKCL